MLKIAILFAVFASASVYAQFDPFQFVFGRPGFPGFPSPVFPNPGYNPHSGFPNSGGDARSPADFVKNMIPTDGQNVHGSYVTSYSSDGKGKIIYGTNNNGHTREFVFTT